MKTRVNLICLISMTLCLFCGHENGQQVVLSGDTKATRGQVKKQKPAPGAKQQLLTISKETTYYTEPLDEHGFVDYVAAVNAKLSQGVAPENNAAVCYLRASPVNETYPKAMEKISELIGIPVPKFIDCERDFELYLYKKYLAEKKGDNSVINQLIAEQKKKVNQPWKAVDHPEAMAFLETCKPRLELLKAAREKTGYWYPYASLAEKNEPFKMVTIKVNEIQIMRSHNRTINLKIMLDLGEGNFEAAKEDLLTMRYMGHNIARGGTVLEILVGFSIISSASNLENEFANRCPNSKILEEYLAGLKKLPKARSIRESFDKVERIIGIEAVSSFAQHEFGVINNEVFDEAMSLVGSLKVLSKLDYDWNIVAQELNHTFDRSLTYMSLPRNDRSIKLEELNNELDKCRENILSAGQIFMNLTSKKARSETMGKLLFDILKPGIESAINAEDRTSMRGKLSELVCMLNLYNLKNGQYPASLQQLTPMYLTEIPQDIFAEAPLKYQSDGKTYTLYSVGVNMVDDGGKDLNNSPNTDDLVYKKR